MSKSIQCPKCGSRDFIAAKSSGKSLSLSKSLIGGALIGPPGLIAGAILGTKGKVTLICKDCGHSWKEKL